jgi:hypothetical protein
VRLAGFHQRGSNFFVVGVLSKLDKREKKRRTANRTFGVAGPSSMNGQLERTSFVDYRVGATTHKRPQWRRIFWPICRA